MIHFQLNGRSVSVDATPDTPLLWVLRDPLNLTGTKFGCGKGLCGACTVHLDGRSVKSCQLLAVQTDGHEVTTIEGLATEAGLHPMQESFHEHHALQCGYCTPGMIMQAIDVLNTHPDPTEEQIRLGLEGNLCRCTGYHNIVKAVAAAAKAPGAAAVSSSKVGD